MQPWLSMAHHPGEISLRQRLAARSRTIAAVLVLVVAVSAPDARAGRDRTAEATVLCATPTTFAHRLVAVDDAGRLVALSVSQSIPAGQRVRLEARALSGRGAVSAATTAVRRLGPETRPIIVRSRLIEGGYTHYGFYRNGRSWGCSVGFDEHATASVVALIVSGRVGTVRLGLRAGRLVHLWPTEAPRGHRVRAEHARDDIQRFVSLIARGDSVSACTGASRDALLIHGGRDGCVMDYEAAKFLYRDTFAGASIEEIRFFELAGDAYAVAAIRRPRSPLLMLFVLERGRYRFSSDLQLTRIELW